MEKKQLNIPAILEQRNWNKEKIKKFNAYYHVAKACNNNFVNVNMNSVINTLAEYFELELSATGVNKEVYFIKYGEELQGQISYHGFLTLFERVYNENIVECYFETIKDYHKLVDDIYMIDHEKMLESPGDILMFYGRIGVKNKADKVRYFEERMTLVEMIKHKEEYSKAKTNSPWNTSFEAMATKTLIKKVLRKVAKDKSLSYSQYEYEKLKKALLVDQATVTENQEIKHIDNPQNDKKIEYFNEKHEKMIKKYEQLKQEEFEEQEIENDEAFD